MFVFCRECGFLPSARQKSRSFGGRRGSCYPNPLTCHARRVTRDGDRTRTHAMISEIHQQVIYLTSLGHFNNGNLFKPPSSGIGIKNGRRNKNAYRQIICVQEPTQKRYDCSMIPCGRKARPTEDNLLLRYSVSLEL